MNNATDINAPVAITSPARPPTSLLFSRGNLISSRIASNKSSTARPSTAVRGVNYVANLSASERHRFDQLYLEAKQQTLSNTNASVDPKQEAIPQIKFKNLETKIVNLLEYSIQLSAKISTRNSTTNCIEGSSIAVLNSKLTEALNKAKEAFSLDRTLHQFRAQYGENMYHSFDLTYTVFFNMAELYEMNGMYIESLNTYSIMTKNKMFSNVNQLKLNMGNIYYKMGLYTKAIKMYRMALDSAPNNLKQLRLKITHNIGIIFVRMGQYIDAASSFEYIVAERADIRSGIHLILCYYAVGNVEKIKSTFRRVCDIQPMEAENGLEMETNVIKIQRHTNDGGMVADTSKEKTQRSDYQQRFTVSSAHSIRKLSGNIERDENFSLRQKLDDQERKRHITNALKKDELAGYITRQQNIDKRAITMIVDLISPLIDENYNEGYNWCIEVIKNSNFAWLANELELNKALVYLRQNNISQAIETLQMHNKKFEKSLTTNALINLTFIYLNLGNFDMAAQCVDQLNDFGAIQLNAMALVNASIIDFERGNYSAARIKLERALQIQPYHFEANYNLGLVGLQDNNVKLIQEQFEQLKTKIMVPHSIQHSHVYFQLANLKEMLHINSKQAYNIQNTATKDSLQSYLQVIGIAATDTDSRLFNKVGTLYEQMQEHQEANHCYNEAYRVNPSNINIASSIASYFIKLQATEKAVYYYERAVLTNPNDPNLMLRVASCFRNSYLPPKQYLNIFEKIYNHFPDNLTCIRALIQVTKSLGLTDLHEKYSMEFARLHKVVIEREISQNFLQQRHSSNSTNSINGLKGIFNSMDIHR